MTNNNPKLISIVIPYYNSKSEYFLEATHSILAQYYKNWEVIIINDGSNIESRNFIYKLQESLNDKRFSIINHKENCGVSVARNTGIKLAKGELITFLDPDDFLLPWDLEKIINVFNKNPDCLILSTDYLYYLKFGPIQKICRNKIFDKFLKSQEKEVDILKFIFPRLILKKEVFHELKFDPNLRRGEDTDLLIQILNNNLLLKRIALLKETGYVYRFYPSKKRLTHNLYFRLAAWEILKNKYKNKESDLVQSTMKNVEASALEIKYSTLVKAYLTHGSILRILEQMTRDPRSLKEKIKCLMAIAKVIIEEKVLLPMFGINLKFIDILINLKNNFKKVEDTDFILTKIRKVTT